MAEKPQHMVALDRANEVRLERAQVKRDIAAGKEGVLEGAFFLPSIETMTLVELMMARRRWGKTRANKFCNALGIAPEKMVGSLTERQRGLVISSLYVGMTSLYSVNRYPPPRRQF